MYYASRMYGAQLELGQSYSQITSAISICLLENVYFRDTDQTHHQFQMMDQDSGRGFKDGIEVHTIELSKYDISETTITAASPLHQWVFLLLRGHEYDASRLRQLLPAIWLQSSH